MERQFHRNESSTGANVPQNESSWNVLSQGMIVPQERKFEGANVPRERKFSLWTFHSRERKCRGTKRPGFGNRMFHYFASSPPGRFATTLDDSLPGHFVTWTVHHLDVSPL